MTGEFWITVLAIAVGPLAAVLVGSRLQSLAEQRSRKLGVYRSLMATRRTPLNLQRVEALNLVDVEFAKSKEVIKEFKKLVEIYNDQARWKAEDPRVREQVVQAVNDQSADLLRAIGSELGFPYESLDLLRGGYYPEAFEIIEGQQHEAREFLVALSRGTRALPIVDSPPDAKNEANQ